MGFAVLLSGRDWLEPTFYRRKPMISDFEPRNDFENFLSSEFNAMSGAPAPAHDPFEAGMLIVNALSEDLALDMLEIDLDDF